MHRRLPLLLLVAAALTLAACTTTPSPALTDRDWELVWVPAFPAMPDGVATPKVRFGWSEGRLTGNTGCNSASASYTVEGDRLAIGPLITTKRACVDPRGNELERAYGGALEGTRRYRIAGGQLELLDDGGTVLARFQ